MTETSETSGPATLPATIKSTSSAESSAGPSPSPSPDGPQTDLFGQPLAPARPSAKRESGAHAQSAKARCLSGALAELASQCAPTVAMPGTPTSGTCGPKSGGSWPDAGLQSALESRLRVLLASTGSPLYEHLWRSSPMISGAPICRLLARARRISDNACFGWPTPKESDQNGVRELDGSRGMGLNDVVAMTGWPSPMAGTPAQKGYNEAGNTDSGRKTVALASGWPTPKAQRPDQDTTHKRGNPTLAKVAGWATPAARDGRSESATPEFDEKRNAHPRGKPLSYEVLGTTPSTSDALTEKPARFRLNPAFSLWLMGYPRRWMALAPSRASVRSGARAMPLFPKPLPPS